MLLCTTALFSSAVPELRLLETNLGTSAPMIVIIKYPCESRFIIPLAPGPNWSMLLPSFSETEVTSVHVPTSSPRFAPGCRLYKLRSPAGGTLSQQVSPCCLSPRLMIADQVVRY